MREAEMEKIGMEKIGMEKELKISSFSVEGKKVTLYQPLESMVEKNLAQPKTDLEFDMERKNIKRGRKLAKAPTKKSGKFQHFLDAENKVVAIYGYTDNYDLPAQYIFFEYHSSETIVYSFDILEKIDYIQHSILKIGKTIPWRNLDKKGIFK